MSSRDVVILGSGLAGLSAGVHLLEAAPGRFRVRILERGHVTGGKASSMPHVDDATGRTFTVDHGFHVFFDYPNLGARLESLGAMGGMTELRHDVLMWSGGTVRRFRAVPLPSPFHLLAGGLESGLFGVVEGLAVFRFLAEIFVLEIDRLSERERRTLDETSFADYARDHGLTQDILQSSFFRFVTQSAFIYPYPMSALAAVAAIQLVSQSYDAVAMRYMNVGLGEAIAAPLVRHFLRQGGVLETFNQAQRIEVSGGKVTSVAVQASRHFIHSAEMASGILSNYASVETPVAPPSPPGPAGAHAAAGDDAPAGTVTHVSADYYVAALPPLDLVGTLTQESLALPYFDAITRLKTQMTIALTVWYDRKVSPADADGAIVALPGPFSTVCDLARVQSDPEGTGSVVQFVGENGAFTDKTDQEVIAAAMAVLHTLWPASAIAVVEKSYFHRGRHDAFFLTTPGSDALRPTAASPYSNLVLAGDYTQTGLRVICMEGAYISGMQAANEILAREGLPRLPIAPMRQPGGATQVARLARRLLARQA